MPAVEHKTLFQAFAKQTEFINAALSGNHDFILYGGSMRGGKTVAIIAFFVMLSRMFAGSKHVICRKTFARIRDTVLPTFYMIVPDQWIKYEPSNGNGWECTFHNGSVIKFYAENIDKDKELLRFRGLEYDCIGFDELDVTEKTFEIGFERSGTHRMSERQAGTYDCPYLVVASSNPQRGWVKRRIYDKWVKKQLPDRWLYLRSSVYDNPHVTKQWIEKQKHNMSPMRFEMMMNGNWEINLNQQPFFYDFVRERHIASGLSIRNDLVLWLSFDFNYSPTVAIVAQMDGINIRVIAEHTATGGTQNLCQQLKRYRTHPAGIYITGDFSGSTRHTAAKNTDYEIIADELMIPPQWFVNIKTANKDFTYSRNLVNYAFLHLDIQIDDRCEQLIGDIETGQVDDKGKLVKDRDQNCQDHGDAFRYLIDALFRRGIADINDLVDDYKMAKAS